MVGDELVERARPGDEDGHAGLAPPARPAHLLPRRRDRARVAREDGDVQPTDVDAQLQRIGADDAQHFACAQAGLDVAPLSWEVAAAVAADPLQRTATLAERLAQAR